MFGWKIWRRFWSCARRCWKLLVATCHGWEREASAARDCRRSGRHAASSHGTRDATHNLCRGDWDICDAGVEFDFAHHAVRNRRAESAGAGAGLCRHRSGRFPGGVYSGAARGVDRADGSAAGGIKAAVSRQLLPNYQLLRSFGTRSGVQLHNFSTVGRLLWCLACL